MDKLPACTIGKKHAWEFVRNVTLTSINGRGAHIRFRGRYKCACGASKIGQSQDELEANHG